MKLKHSHLTYIVTHFKKIMPSSSNYATPSRRSLERSITQHLYSCTNRDDVPSQGALNFHSMIVLYYNFTYHRRNCFPPCQIKTVLMHVSVCCFPNVFRCLDARSFRPRGVDRGFSVRNLYTLVFYVLQMIVSNFHQSANFLNFNGYAIWPLLGIPNFVFIIVIW